MLSHQQCSTAHTGVGLDAWSPGGGGGGGGGGEGSRPPFCGTPVAPAAAAPPSAGAPDLTGTCEAAAALAGALDG